MQEYWVVDGYNLLHGLKGRMDKKIRLSREILFAQLASFTSMEPRKMLVVLDGKGSEEEFKGFNTGSFEICYSQKISADTFIEKFLYDNKAQYSLVVVTNDTAILNIARGVGARTVRAEDFRLLLKDTKKESGDILFNREIDGHRFNRPFDSKLKNFPKDDKH